MAFIVNEIMLAEPSYERIACSRGSSLIEVNSTSKTMPMLLPYIYGNDERILENKHVLDSQEVCANGTIGV